MPGGLGALVAAPLGHTSGSHCGILPPAAKDGQQRHPVYQVTIRLYLQQAQKDPREKGRRHGLAIILGEKDQVFRFAGVAFL